MGKSLSPERAAGRVTLNTLTSSRRNIGWNLLWLQPLLFIAVFFALTFAGFAQAPVEVLNQKVTNGSAEQKRDALMQLRNLRSEAASRAAAPALQDSNDMVRATAAATVVFLPKQEALRVLMPLLKDKSPFVRKEVAYAVGEVSDPTPLLGEDKDDDIASALRLLLEKDKDLEVRSAAAIAMGKAGGLHSVWYLYFFLQSTPKSEANDFLRRSAVRSIGTVAVRLRKSSEELPAPRRDISPDKYREMDFSQYFRSFGSASRTLVEILQNKSESDDIRREAAEALGNIGVLSAEPALSANSAAGDPYLANICKEALQKLKNIKPF